MHGFLSTFVFLFAVIDPIGTVPVYLHVASRAPAEMRRSIAIRAVIIAGVVLLFFIVLGQLLLDAISIQLAAFQTSGGIILFLFALDMIFGSSKPERESAQADTADARDLAVFPLAIPSISGPGAILAVMLLTDNDTYTLLQQTITTAIVFVVLAIVLACLLLADRIHHIIGESGASVISRIMGLIMAAVAAQATLTGIKEFYSIGTWT